MHENPFFPWLHCLIILTLSYRPQQILLPEGRVTASWLFLCLQLLILSWLLRLFLLCRHCILLYFYKDCCCLCFGKEWTWSDLTCDPCHSESGQSFGQLAISAVSRIQWFGGPWGAGWGSYTESGVPSSAVSFSEVSSYSLLSGSFDQKDGEFGLLSEHSTPQSYTHKGKSTLPDTF